MGFITPAAVESGDAIAVVAPSSPFDPEDFARGIAWLRERYDVRFDPGVLTRTFYLAGDDARRGGELARAMVDPSVKAIVAARGGYGAMRILDALPWDAWAARPSWIVGFSDITALHAVACARGIASIHAPHVTGLGAPEERGVARLRDAFQLALQEPRAARAWRDLRVIHEGLGVAVEGPIVGGNLAMIEAMAAAGRLVWPRGAILLLEDVTERPYRLDRMLTSLALGGHLAHLEAIVLGDFFKCEPGPDGATFEQVLADCTRGLGIPVLGGAPFGHDDTNDAFVLGAPARIDGRTLFFEKA